jgi:murein DD-endopeptidase MepM/ murein hydrolase activator NlpD
VSPALRSTLLSLLLGALLLFGVIGAFAAPSAQGENVYVVQAGDTLIGIAFRYSTTAQTIALTNNLPNPNLIVAGQHLIIPGAVITPTAEPTATITPTVEPQVHVVQAGDTIHTLAVRHGVTVESIVAANKLTDPDYIEVGQRLLIPPPVQSGPLPLPFAAVNLQPSSPIVQGQTMVIRVRLAGTAPPAGTFDGRPIFFERYNQGQGDEYWALAGIHARAEVGSYPLILTTRSGAGQIVTATLIVPVIAGTYGQENIVLSPERLALLDPELVRAEGQKIARIVGVVTPRRLWQGLFIPPVRDVEITSFFGTRRSYNDGPSTSYHEGVDFRGAVGEPVYASAAGRVVLAEPLTVRGSAVILDHGLGVYSGYWHLSQIDVQVGQEVAQGELLGKVGATGLATGSHLHWEIRVLGINVQPLQWTEQLIP